MAEQIVKIQKTIYGLTGFTNTVNTEFSQLLKPIKPPVFNIDTSVSDFFKQYDALFYEIPPSGSEESHLGLAARSLDYLGMSLEDLQAEIDFLREENVNLKTQLTQISGLDANNNVTVTDVNKLTGVNTNQLRNNV
jgi:hypothetical protein